jgi:hypothetical protein
MSHRIVSTVIAVLTLLFGTGALMFGLAARPAPEVAAPASPMPPTHRNFTDSSCTTCHR